MKLAYCIQPLLREEGMEKSETLKTVNRFFHSVLYPNVFGLRLLLVIHLAVGCWGLLEPGLISLHSLHQVTQGWLPEASAFLCHWQLVTVIPQGATPLKENTRT